MRSTFLFILLLLQQPFGMNLLAQNAGDAVFAGVQVHTVNIVFSQPDYWDSLTTYYQQGHEQYIAATVFVNGVRFDSVGVRFKGNASYFHPNNKKPFRLSFDQYRSAQRWDGLKGVHLNNCWEDPTYMREKIHLDFCRDAGIAAPRANYVSLSINDELFGFYSLVEHVDKTFLSTRYGDTTGDLFKAKDAFVSPTLSDFRWYGVDTAAYYSHYELKTEGSPTAWQRLVNVIDTLNNTSQLASSLSTKVNLNNFFRAVAADILLGNLDSYVHSEQNFYFYFLSSTNLLEWIVWDAGLSLGGMPPHGGVLDIESLALSYVKDTAQHPLFGKIVSNPSLKNAYLRAFCQLYNTHYSSTELIAHVDSIATVIRPFVYADFRKEYTDQNFEQNIDHEIFVGSGRKPGLKSFLTLRASSVESQLSTLSALSGNCNQFLAQGDVVINEFMAQNDSIPDPSGEADDWIELYNNTNNTIVLDGMFLTDDVANPTQWQFPSGTTIAPHGFLIVWADSDLAQPGVHANFKLSVNGDYLRFSNVDTTILDSVTFGAQAANRSSARIPNGTGSFYQGNPTFNADNGTTITNPPALTTLILPQYIEGLNGTNSNRLPFAFRARLTGLMSNATYRYVNQVVTSSDAPTTNGSGNCIFVQQSGSWIRTTGPSLATVGNHGTFVTDANGMFEGWFVSEPTGNARFTPSRFVFMRIHLNDGAGGTTAAWRLTTTDSVRVLKLSPVANDSCGTGLRGMSIASAKDFVFAYDNVAGLGRPISGSFIELDGTANTIPNNYAAFYAISVDTVSGAFGFVVPNLLPNGIRRVERRALTTGAIADSSLDSNGVWPSGANTINPLGGTSEIVLNGKDVPLAPVKASAKFYLEGAFNVGAMTTLLKSSGILATRFNAIPIPSSAVDSITIEIRDSSNVDSATVRKFKPAWLLSDGTIRNFADTTKNYVEFNVGSTNYFMLVHHRNHLSVRTANQPLFAGSATPYDFSTAQSQGFGTEPMKEVATNVFALYAGDVNSSKSIDAQDVNAVLNGLNSIGYLNADLNFSGIVTITDLNFVFGNMNRVSQGKPRSLSNSDK